MGARIEHLVTSGQFSLDGGTWDVDNNVWIVGDDHEVVVIDAAHDADAILAGLVTLYSNLSADAAAPENPSHEYFRERYERSQDLGRDSLTHLQELGELPAGVDPGDLAQLMIAAVDGLQLL